MDSSIPPEKNCYKRAARRQAWLPLPRIVMTALRSSRRPPGGSKPPSTSAVWRMPLVWLSSALVKDSCLSQEGRYASRPSPLFSFRCFFKLYTKHVPLPQLSGRTTSLRVNLRDWPEYDARQIEKKKKSRIFFPFCHPAGKSDIKMNTPANTGYLRLTVDVSSPDPAAADVDCI
ncbi:hypothetical protein CIRG_02027 [Coccidioides immitis RMSCC 2394]|uniref:Uncharacterized protein n=1 Tax=Coccidioides immitis RMSCC 2394 TaxID=404692 RepID=A0A0J6Y5F4_COCIT|nr:hypothetical protein CIRG_02027 [Coccidioides immitis RMSCC 2394]